ncbi:bifunctional UDP-N-acetylmuramoyl-tripeptide:D-alanyl-D-alanine ligase/alanine racemase [Bacteroidales bacterium OttesenSCG-928-M06]|nr:bifunctional UDP-N-acetylmuramoyl-tripeptide:D-alanyl-D-alanine ligase/alanine racemase [Bacteroidales bacterium OttesenSCG-928-M06]
MKLSIQKIASVIQAEMQLVIPEAKIDILLTDSRSLSEPTTTLFFALCTEHNDGHNYIYDLYQKGVRNFVVQHEFKGMDKLLNVNCLWVKDTLLALQELAVYHRKQYAIPVIGITGSNGKTIVKEWLYQLLHDIYAIVRSPRSYNSQIGVPLSVWQLSDRTELGIFEAGISEPSEMSRLENIIHPTIGIFTVLGEAHRENFISQEEKCLEKLNLFEHSEVIIYNEDQILLKYCLEQKGLLGKSFTWSVRNVQASLYISEIKKEIDHTLIFYRKFSQESQRIKKEEYDFIKVPFTDDASIEDSIHCLALICYLNPDLTNLSQRFERLEPVAMRMDVNKGINGNILINDTYNSDINSLSIALDFLSRRSVDKSLKKVLILSDILQSGMVPAAFYRKVAELIHQKNVEHIIGIGPNMMSNSNLFNVEKEFYPTTDSFLDSGNWRNIKKSIVLIKGSRNFRFERISEQLEEKVHQTVLEVNLDAVIFNLRYFQSKLKPETKIICMVKAFGYGIGSYELAKTLQDRGVGYLAVALADEGAELRREGISMPIMVMNPEEHAFNTLFEYNLEPEIYDMHMLDAIIKETERRGILDYPIHIKLDTGMKRLGFDKEEISLLVQKIKKQTGVVVKSVFSHLAGSDSPFLDDFTLKQIDRYNEEAKMVQELLGYTFLKHILNSAGIERFPSAQLDMVRLGIGLYGISVEDEKNLKPVATLKTKILQIRVVRKGESVGYGRKGVMTRDSRIAIIPIGYADGLDRRLGNGSGKMLLNNQQVSTVGNICMDISMIDVTDMVAEEGDEVIIFGENITISQLAEQLETIPYEILTSISPRVKRIYYKE